MPDVLGLSDATSNSGRAAAGSWAIPSVKGRATTVIPAAASDDRCIVDYLPVADRRVKREIASAGLLAPRSANLDDGPFLDLLQVAGAQNIGHLEGGSNHCPCKIRFRRGEPLH